MVTPLNLACAAAQTFFINGLIQTNGKIIFNPNWKKIEILKAGACSFAAACGFTLADKLYPALAGRINLPGDGLYGTLAKIGLKLLAGHLFSSTAVVHLDTLQKWINYPRQ